MRQISRFRDELADREAIRDLMYRYLRAGDREDAELLSSVFWPDATFEHPMFAGTAREWIAMLGAGEASVGLELCHHTVGNILLEIEGDEARAESYYRAVLRRVRPDGTCFDLSTAGRYLDVLTRRDGEWRLSSRTVVRDWFREFPDAADPQVAVLGGPARPGTRDRTDPSYAYITKS